MRWLMILGAMAVLLAGCVRSGPVRQVSLAKVDPAAAMQPVAGAGVTPLRVVAASLISPQETMRSYGAFFAYLGRELGRPVEMVQRRTYQEAYDLLQSGVIDLGLVCTYVYVKGQKEFGLTAIAAPEVGGKAEYYSLIITHADSAISQFSDLAGKRFAFTDPLSNSGRMYPLALLKAVGRDPGSFFASTTYTYSHDNSIKAVLQHVVDGAAVDSLVYDQWTARNPGLTGKLRVIGRSAAFASPPFVAAPGLKPEVRLAVQEALLAMHQNPEGRAILSVIGVDRFIAVTDADFQSVRDNAARAGVSP